MFDTRCCRCRSRQTQQQQCSDDEVSDTGGDYGRDPRPCCQKTRRCTGVKILIQHTHVTQPRHHLLKFFLELQTRFPTELTVDLISRIHKVVQHPHFHHLCHCSYFAVRPATTTISGTPSESTLLGADGRGARDAV